MCNGSLFHTWDKWKVVDRAPYVLVDKLTKESHEVGVIIEQERFCKTCGLTQVRQDTTRV